MILNEDLKILAGIQSHRNIENPLPKLIFEEQQQQLIETQRIIDSQKTVITHFTTFQEKIEKYASMIELIKSICENDQAKVFVNGLYESKYTTLQQFADIVINDELPTVMIYLEKHYYSIKADIDDINKLSEIINEDNAEIFFVANNIISQDEKHNLTIPMYKHNTLEEKIYREISYGAQITYISENLSIITDSGKKYYTTLSRQHISILENKGFLI